jgi:hypothetical protein
MMNRVFVIPKSYEETESLLLEAIREQQPEKIKSLHEMGAIKALFERYSEAITNCRDLLDDYIIHETKNVVLDSNYELALQLCEIGVINLSLAMFLSMGIKNPPKIVKFLCFQSRITIKEAVIQTWKEGRYYQSNVKSFLKKPGGISTFTIRSLRQVGLLSPRNKELFQKRLTKKFKKQKVFIKNKKL